MPEVKQNPLRNNLYLPLSIPEAVYLRGALKTAIKQMKSGEEREICLQVLDRLNDMYLDITSYSNLPF